jgi:hypothetical protein
MRWIPDVCEIGAARVVSIATTRPCSTLDDGSGGASRPRGEANKAAKDSERSGAGDKASCAFKPKFGGPFALKRGGPVSARLAHPLALNHTRLWRAQAPRHGAPIKRWLRRNLLIVVRTKPVKRCQVRLPAQKSHPASS